MGKIVIIGNQKGGVGKSTITAMVAMYLHGLGKKVLVIDADDLQRSLSKIREREELDGVDAYELVDSTTRELPQLINGIKNVYDYIFIDLPGNLKQEGVIQVYFKADIIIVPVSLTELDIDSTKDFITFLKDKVKKVKELNFEKLEIACILNKVKTNTQETKMFLEEEDILGVEILRPFIKDSVSLQREVSTIREANKEYFPLMERIVNLIDK